jgi:hypothetical protein
MNATSFTTAFLVDQTPDQAFAAIRDVRGWWSEGVEGGTADVGDEFTYRYGDLHVSKQRLTEVAPGRRMVWLVLDATLSFTRDRAEWKGTKVVFEVSRKGNQTEVRFTHQGLVPALECFEDCSSAWGSYVNGSLKSLIATGKGKPDRKAKIAEEDVPAETVKARSRPAEDAG